MESLKRGAGEIINTAVEGIKNRASKIKRKIQKGAEQEKIAFPETGKLSADLRTICEEMLLISGIKILHRDGYSYRLDPVPIVFHGRKEEIVLVSGITTQQDPSSADTIILKVLGKKSEFWINRGYSDRPPFCSVMMLEGDIYTVGRLAKPREIRAQLRRGQLMNEVLPFLK